MLGKQWLNRYESIDRRGSAVERSHRRQRKLDGIIAWYFDHVMELLPLMLQAGLLLLGCALSLYLWQINIIVASVVLTVTLFGVILYLFILIAGTASDSCPYQTPGARFFRHILHRLLPTLYSAFAAIPPVISSTSSRVFQTSLCCRVFFDWWSLMRRPWYSRHNIAWTLLFFFCLPLAPVHDAYCLGRAIFRSLVAPSKTVYQRLMGKIRTTYPSFIDASLQTPNPDYQTIIFDLRCISWILQTSLDKAIHLSAFKHLISMPQLARFHSTLVMDCFNIFIGCVSVSKNQAVVIQGLEQLATASADGFFRVLHHLATVDPTSSALVELKRRYNEVFPSELDFAGLPFHPTMTKIHALAGRFGNPRDIRWPDPRLSVQAHIPFARHIVEVAQEKYQHTQKVPRWTLCSALYFLSLCPLSPASVVADCLTIVAIDLGCDISNMTISEERYVHMGLLLAFLTKNQCTGGVCLKPHHPEAQNHGRSFWLRLDHLKTQGYQHPVPICNLFGAKGAARDDGRNLKCRQGLKSRRLKHREVYVASSCALHLQVVRKTKPYFLESSHNTHIALRTLERCIEQ